MTDREKPIPNKRASGSDKAVHPSKEGGSQQQKAQEWGGGSQASKGPGHARRQEEREFERERPLSRRPALSARLQARSAEQALLFEHGISHRGQQ